MHTRCDKSHSKTTREKTGAWALTREGGANLAHGQRAETYELECHAAALGRHERAKHTDEGTRHGVRLLVALPHTNIPILGGPNEIDMNTP